MNSTTIKIDGYKLRSLLESSTGKSIYEIAKESGYSKNVISNAVKAGYASSAVQNIAKLYGISPDAYKLVEEVKDNTPRQLSISDYEAIQREELKALIKDVLFEIFYNSEIVIQNDKVKGNRLFLQERGAQ